MNKKQLYESIMKDVSKVVSKHLNEKTDSPLIGKTIRIFELEGEKDDRYFGKTGVVEYVDDIGQLHGTWGGLAIIPEVDEFEVLD